MKKVLLLLVFLSGTAAFAQTGIKEGKVFDNMFLQFGGGATYSEFEKQGIPDNQFFDFVRPNVFLNIGKNFHPAMGARISLGWGQNVSFVPVNGKFTGEKETFNRMQVFGDAMVSLTNWFGGFNPNRVCNLNLIGGVGYIRGFSGDNYVEKTQQIAARGGFNLSFKLNNTWDIFTEALVYATDDDYNNIVIDYPYDGSIDWTVGLTYRFKNADGTRGFQRISDNAALIDELNLKINNLRDAALRDQNTIADLTDEINRLKNEKVKEVVVQDKRMVIAVFDFTINRSNIRSDQKHTLLRIKEMYESGAKVTIKGYADKNTGNAKINERLGNERASVVRDALVKEGIPESMITTVNYGDREQYYKFNDINRTAIVIIELP